MSHCSKRQYPARVIAPSARLITGHEAPRSDRRHRQHAAIMLRSGPACHPNSTSHPQPVPAWTLGASSALEPVTVPAGARAAHPPPSTPARGHPHRAGNPTFRGNLTPSRPRDLLGASVVRGKAARKRTCHGRHLAARPIPSQVYRRSITPCNREPLAKPPHQTPGHPARAIRHDLQHSPGRRERAPLAATLAGGITDRICRLSERPSPMFAPCLLGCRGTAR